VREVLDSLQQRYYALEEEMEDYPENIRDELIVSWIRELDRTVGRVRKQAADEMIQKLKPDCQRAVRDSQASCSQKNGVLPRLELMGEITDEEDDVDSEFGAE
jgi:hypothetical protein